MTAGNRQYLINHRLIIVSLSPRVSHMLINVWRPQYQHCPPQMSYIWSCMPPSHSLSLSLSLFPTHRSYMAGPPNYSILRYAHFNILYSLYIYFTHLREGRLRSITTWAINPGTNVTPTYSAPRETEREAFSGLMSLL